MFYAGSMVKNDYLCAQIMAINALSILIPTYNDLCVRLVDDLRQQAEAAGFDYEILVADDGSTDTDVITKNSEINQWPHCHYLRQSQNIGRAAIRNHLARQARYDHLLFIDSDMTLVRPDYLSRYVSTAGDDVIDGGVCIGGDADALKGNLRYRYEKAAEHEHTAEKRRLHPYQDFHTANFLIRRNLMLAHPFDERFRHYGYEDVLFGKQLRADRIAITTSTTLWASAPLNPTPTLCPRLKKACTPSVSSAMNCEATPAYSHSPTASTFRRYCGSSASPTACLALSSAAISAAITPISVCSASTSSVISSRCKGTNNFPNHQTFLQVFSNIFILHYKKLQYGNSTTHDVCVSVFFVLCLFCLFSFSRNSHTQHSHHNIIIYY